MSSHAQRQGPLLAWLLVWGAAVGGGLVGALVLARWLWRVPSLELLAPGMPPNTALGLLLASAALGLLSSPKLRTARWVAGRCCAVVLITLGAITLFQRLSGLDLGFEEVLWRWSERASRTPPHASAPNTASCFVLFGSALWLRGRRQPLSAWWADSLVLLALLGALLAFNGYLHGAFQLAGAPRYLPQFGMGLYTSLTLLVLGVGFLCMRPEQGLMGQLTRDTLGGFLARWLVPVGLLGPPVVGVVLESLHRAGIIIGPARSALFSTIMSLGGVALVLLSSLALNRIDTERRRATTALATSEARYRGLLETAPDPVVIIDSAGHIRFVNAQAEHVLGYRSEELLGQEVEVLIPQRYRETHRRYRERFVAMPEVRKMGRGLTLYARRKDGSELPVDISLSPFSSPEGLTVTTIIRDVTEREENLARVQAARAEAERERTLLEALLDSAPVGILFVERATERVRCNSVLETMLGQTLEPDSGRRQYLHSLRHLDGQAMRVDELPSTRALEGHEVRAEEYLVCRAEQRLPVLASAAPVRGEDGEVRGAIVTIQDISTRRELERLREEYVGLISHDLRTPLQNISLRAQLLLRVLRQKQLAEESASAEALLRNARRMSEMVEELLEGSRLEAGQVELHREPLDLVRFLEEVLERAMPPDARARLRLEGGATVPEVPADPFRLERVVVNLLTNALKYSESGTPVVLRLEREGGQVKVSVRDHGQGLRPEEAERLFTKYYRTQEGQRAKGVGLGLYISRLIVEAHGGHIQVESRPGEGSTFTFTLPLKAS